MCVRPAPKSPARPACLVVLALPVLLHARSTHADTLNVPAEYTSIQSAINAAVDGDEVLIAPGRYAITQLLSINNKAITLRGSGGAAVTTVSMGSIFGLVQLSNTEADTVFDGLTFSGGTNISTSAGAITVSGGATFTNCVIRDCFDTSALDWNGTNDLVVTDCQFIDNAELNGQGGAIDLSGSGPGTATITGCTFTGNSASSSRAGAIFGGANALIEDCMFESNDCGTDGGAVSLNSVSGASAVLNCQFIGNSADALGGAVLGDGPNISIQGCTFENNSAATGGGAYVRNGATVSAGIFTNNSANLGAGLAVEDAQAVDCTFAGNTSTGNGGAMEALGATSTLTNCNASGNMAGGIGGGLHIATGATVTMQDSTLCANMPDQIGSAGLLLATNVIACNQIGVATGACCLPLGECATTTEADCGAAGGTYHGDGATCERAMCTPPPTCLADIVDSGTFQPPPDGTVDGADLAYLLGAWGACE